MINVNKTYMIMFKEKMFNKNKIKNNLKKIASLIIPITAIVFCVFVYQNIFNLSVALILILLLINKAHNYFTENILPKIEKKDDLLIIYLIIRSLKTPIKFLLSAIFIIVEFDLLNKEFSFPEGYQKFIQTGWEYFLVFFASWVFLRFSERLKFYLISTNKEKVEHLDDEAEEASLKYVKTTLDAAFKIVNFAIITTAMLSIFQLLGVSLSGLLAFGGFSGLVLGFASKDLFANIFGGIMLYLNRPFDIGDWVRSPDRDIEGTVEKIGWLVTVIIKLDKKPLYIPNSIFNSISVENPSRMTHRRIKEHFKMSVSHLDKVPKITKEIKQMIFEHNGIDHKELVMVNLDNINSNYLELFIYCFTNTTLLQGYHDIKQNILYKSGEILKENNCEFAPTENHIKIDKGN
jgi:small-conductance mechanosensitive channel